MSNSLTKAAYKVVEAYHGAGGDTLAQAIDALSSAVCAEQADNLADVLATPPASTSTAIAAGEWQSPDLRDIYGDVERFRAHDLGNNRHRDLLRGALDMLRAADMELIDGLAATPKAASEDSLATAKARLSIASVKGRNSGHERIEVITDDVAVLIAAHSDLGRRAASQPDPEWLNDPASVEGGMPECPNCEGQGGFPGQPPHDGMCGSCDGSGTAPKAASEDGATGFNRACEKSWDATHRVLWRHASEQQRAEWAVGIRAALHDAKEAGE